MLSVRNRHLRLCLLPRHAVGSNSSTIPKPFLRFESSKQPYSVSFFVIGFGSTLSNGLRFLVRERGYRPYAQNYSIFLAKGRSFNPIDRPIWEPVWVWNGFEWAYGMGQSECFEKRCCVLNRFRFLIWSYCCSSECILYTGRGKKGIWA